MHIEIEYRDGSIERLPVELEGFRVSRGPNWIPGHAVTDPVRCYFQRDFFEAALDEGHVREGDVAEDDLSIGLEPFRWRLVGDEADACRGKLSEWLEIVGEQFDPSGNLPSHVDPGLARRFESDRQCWFEWLDDPEEELATIAAGSPRP